MNQWCLVPFSISISSMVRFVVFFPRPAEWVRAWARNDRRQQPSDTPLNNHTGKAFHDALSIYHQFMAWVKNDLSAKWHSINNMDGKRERERVDTQIYKRIRRSFWAMCLLVILHFHLLPVEIHTNTQTPFRLAIKTRRNRCQRNMNTIIEKDRFFLSFSRKCDGCANNSKLCRTFLRLSFLLFSLDYCIHFHFIRSIFCVITRTRNQKYNSLRYIGRGWKQTPVYALRFVCSRVRCYMHNMCINASIPKHSLAKYLVPRSFSVVGFILTLNCFQPFR